MKSSGIWSIQNARCCQWGQRAGTSFFTLVIKRNPYLPVKENSGISDYISGGSNTNDTGFIILDCYLLICNYHQETSNQRRTREKRKAKKSKTSKSSGDNIVTQVPALVIPLLSKTVLAMGKPCFSPQEPSNIYHDHPLVGRHQVHYARVTLITAPGIHRSSSQCISPDLGTT